ncbi:hypothetical protein OG252_21020 [Streptomyces sp. NBC_01352]|uniref:hypothetical protein n=1 Tax=unclassified Streptomyces TaxID=2593676 RepID=UPI00225658C2|nr:MULTISPECIES: hypothetical protein [unclassified Streptomyces]MCX4698463.1 hypothetical protein [Streptomyces sp. NBC_01373]
MATMTTDRLSEPTTMTMTTMTMTRDSAEAVEAVRDGHGCRGESRPTTTVPVMPLWERLPTGARG